MTTPAQEPEAAAGAGGDAPSPATPVARDAGDGRERARILRAIEEEWLPRLKATRDAWAAGLPPEAPTEWEPGAAYVRVSSPRSLARDSPDNQLAQALALMAQHRYYVAPDGVFFDVESATDIGPRAAFKRLLEAAVAGGYKAIGAFINERVFRNLEQSLQVKRSFRIRGVNLLYLGRYEGDQRNPAAWQLETAQDAAAELHARNTSYYVGLTFEAASRAGRPVGKVPEVYREKERDEPFLGRRGSVISWELAEPLASIMREGCRRYLGGASHAELAAWSSTTELQGITPRGRVMDRFWWRQTLTNPRFAGYQVPTVYMGFKPGRESPPRPKRTASSELVRCVLPALWTLEDYRRIHEIGQSRARGPKVRKSYHQYLLSGLAFDAKCGHRMGIIGFGRRYPERHWMRCNVVGTDGAHGKGIRVDVAAQELDELISGIRIDDGDLLRQVEEELRELARRQQEERQQFRADPAIATLRQALALVQAADGQSDLQGDLQRRIAGLEAADSARRDALSEPLVQWQKALARMRDWQSVWANADVSAKNQLLREAKVKVGIAEGAGEKRTRQPGHIAWISAANPVFEFALGVALSSRDSSASRPASDPISAIGMRFRTEAVNELGDLPTLRRLHEDGISLARPAIAVPQNRVELIRQDPAGTWLTVAEVARELRAPLEAVYRLADEGEITTLRLRAGPRPWIVARRADLDAALAAHPQWLAPGAWARPNRAIAELGGGAWMTVSQVAEALGLTVFQVYARRSKGQLPFQFARVTGVGERAALYARADDVHALAASAEEAA